MVKGNKERRQELAARRKEDKALEGERRRGGASMATPVEVRARLLSDAKGNEGGLTGWVVCSMGVEGLEVKHWCEDWFRTGACMLRRCRNAHEISIAHLSGVPPHPGVPVLASATTARGRSVSPAARRVRAASIERGEGSAGGGGRGGGGEGGGEGGGGGQRGSDRTLSNKDLSCVPSVAIFPALEPTPLRMCEVGAKLVYDRTLRTQVRQESPLRFVEWNGKLVFDLYNPSVFAAYCASTSASAPPSLSVDSTTLKSTDEGALEVLRSAGGEAGGNCGEAGGGVSFSQHAHPKPLLSSSNLHVRFASELESVLEVGEGESEQKP